MKNLLNEEINQIQYLFGYKRGFVISEQSDPNVDKKITHLTNIKEKETDEGVKVTYDKLIDYYTKIKNGETAESPDKRYTDFIDSKFTFQTTGTSTPELPKTEPATDLGRIYPKNKQEMEDAVKGNPEKYQMAEYIGSLPESSAKSKACQLAAQKFGTGESSTYQVPIYDRTTKIAYCFVAKK